MTEADIDRMRAEMEKPEATRFEIDEKGNVKQMTNKEAMQEAQKSN